MNVLMINGSPKPNGNTAIALREMEQIFVQEGIQVETVHVGNKNIRGCIGCNKCMEAGKCVFDDLVNETAPKFEACDGLVVGTPVYYASANATLVAFLTRLFYSTRRPPGRAHRYLRRAEQVLRHLRHAHRLRPVLERHPRPGARRGLSGRGGPPGHAHPGPEHGLPDEEHPAGQRGLRHPGAGALPPHQLHPVINLGPSLRLGPVCTLFT